MKIWISFLLIAFFTVQGFAQLSESEAPATDYPDVFTPADTAHKASSENIAKQKSKVKFGMTFGTYFASNFGGAYNYGTFLSPRISYPVNDRFSLSFGARINTSLGTSFYQPFDPMTYPGYQYYPTQSMLYVEGAYKLNENLTVRGAAYQAVNLFKNQHPLQENTNRDYNGIIMGVDYKLGKNVFIQGQIEISNGSGYSPIYGKPGNPAAYPNSPFGTGHRLGF